MRRFAALISVAFVLLFARPAAADLSSSEIRRVLIERSISNYSGNCPCPYNLDRAGRRCGARSAYSKPGGRAPLCFESDVTEEMVERYRAAQGQPY